MICLRKSSYLLERSFKLTLRYCTKLDKNHVSAKDKIKFFTNLLELPDRNATEKLMASRKHMLLLDQEEVMDSFNYLMKVGITVDDVRKQPTILCAKEITLRNRHEVLSECGCPNVSALFFLNYIAITNRSERLLKIQQVIPLEVNLQKRLAEILNITLHLCNENIPLKEVRLHMLQLFFSQNNIMTNDEFRKLIKNYPNAKNKSYRTIKDAVNLLEHEIGIPKEKMKNNFFMLYADPNNLKKLLTMKPIGGIKIADVLRLTPKIMSVSYESLQRTLAHINSFNIPEESITKCLPVLTLNPETVHQRLMDIFSKKEFQAILTYHPGILRLIFHKFKAESRLDYFKHLNIKCFSLSVLAGTHTNFERYVREGPDKTRGKDCVSFLAKIFNKKRKAIREEMSKHPYWCHISMVDMKLTIEKLLCSGFKLEDIYLSIHSVLYPGDVLITRIEKLNETMQIENVHIKDMSSAVKLKLVLYLIEVDFNFSGNGVWIDRLPSDYEKVTPQEVPLSNKRYRYGKKVKIEI